MSTPESGRPPAWRPWLVRAVKLAVVVLVAWGVHRTVLAAAAELERQPWQWRPGWLALSGALYLVGTLPSAWFWHWTMRRLGARPPLGRSVAAYYIGHLGKYVPGKAMVVVLRAGLVRGPETDARSAVAAVFYETLTMMASGGILAAILLLAVVHARWEFVVLAASLALVVALPTIPPVARWLVARLASRTDLSDGRAAAELDWTAMGVGWLASAAGWFVLGLSLEAALAGAGATISNPLAELSICTSAVAVAVVAGFLSFVPGGAVVREAVLMELLAARYGAAQAVVSAILLRLAWLAAELVTAWLAWSAALLRRHREE